MNPPRWSTPYADRVRDDLIRRVDGDVSPAPAATRRGADRRPTERPRLVATGVVALLVVVIGAFAIRAGLDRPLRGETEQPATRPPATATAPERTPAELRSMLFAILPKAARDAPALTWTDRAAAPTGGAIDTSGRTMLLAAVCDGGGTLTISVSGKPDAVVDCTRLRTAGPIDLDAGVSTDPPGSVEFDVRVSSGHPHYVATAVAVDDAHANDPAAGTAP